MRWREAIAACVSGLAFLGLLACGEPGPRPAPGAPRVLVIGIDGLDPVLTERWMAEGHLPNLERLARDGAFMPLGTSVPPQSPVAWASFITGMGPGGHGIFDFLHRDPDTYRPEFSASRTEDPQRTLELGEWVVPLEAGKVELTVRGRPFWLYLEDAGIPVTVFMIPSNFPPAETKGRSLSGMGTPDLQGSPGMFSFYTDIFPFPFDDVVAGGEVFEVDVLDFRVEAELPGPQNPFRKGAPKVTIPFEVFVDPEEPVAMIEIQGRRHVLAEGEWSPWIQVEYTLVPLVQKVTGIVRFYLQGVRPDFRLYATPINIDPSNPAMPISTPPDFSRQLTRELGFFYTQGLPEDTMALSQEIFEDRDYLAQAGLVLEERRRFFDRELARFQEGLLFFYFSSVDTGSHMFWRTMDPEHPAHDPEADAPHADVIRDYYIEMDRAVGQALEAVDERTVLIVMSDHGFAPFRRAVHLNNWLWQNGYLALRDERAPGRYPLFTNVDWSQTRAYGLGLNGLYLNLQGRERQGVVAPGAGAAALLEELEERLLALEDPQTGERAVSRVYRADRVYRGEAVAEAPDLVVGFRRGYRIKWDSALGEFSHEVFSDNEEKWSGDHLMAAEEVPGVLLANRPVALQDPALEDLTVGILELFGLPRPEGMVGRSVFGGAGQED